MKHDV